MSSRTICRKKGEYTSSRTIFFAAITSSRTIFLIIECMIFSFKILELGLVDRFWLLCRHFHQCGFQKKTFPMLGAKLSIKNVFDFSFLLLFFRSRLILLPRKTFLQFTTATNFPKNIKFNFFIDPNRISQ